MRTPLVPRLVLVLLAFTLAAAGGSAATVGTVHLEHSASGEASAAFERGLAQLHNFEYDSAAEAFREARAIEPDFALAAWGEAMTYNHPIWMEQDRDAAMAALKRLGATAEARIALAKLPIEKDLLRAVHLLYGEGDKHARDLAYRDFMESLWERYPSHPEIGAFYALSLMGTAHQGRDFATYMRSAAVTTELFEQFPDHPGIAHYLIHATDDPIHAPLGYRAAQAYSEIAPDAAHAQHMTSHIFLALGLWDETAKANDRAVAVVDRQRAARDLPSIGCGHYPSWQMYAYLQLERREDSSRRMALCYERTSAIPDASLGSFYYMQGLYLFDTRDWGGEVASFAIEREHDEEDAFFRDYLQAVATLKTQAADRAQALARAAAAGERLIASLHAAGEDGEGDAQELDRVNTMLLQLRGWQAQEQGRAEEARQLLEQSVKLESSLPFGFGPPFPPKPAIEALAELLLAQGEHAAAVDAFERSLARTPNRRLSREGLARANAALKQQL